MLSKIKVVALLTIIEEWRSRLLMAIVLFAIVSLYLGLVLTQLAMGFEERFFRDLSFALLELFGLVFVLMTAYRVIVGDVGKGSLLELFLVRGMKPYQYLLGRYLGILSLVALTVLFMATIFFGLCLYKGFLIHKIYTASLGLLFLRLNVMAAVALLLATITSNQASFLVSSFLVYLSAYATGPLKSLTSQSQYQNLLTNVLIRPMTWILPDFSRIDLEASLDAFVNGVHIYSTTNFAHALGYSVVFSSVAIMFCCLVFRKAE